MNDERHMRFAIISPAVGLERFARLSSTHLLLSHVKNPLYWKFYQQLAQDPRQMLILDNSAYEGEVDMHRAINQVHFLGRVDALVMPDIMGGKARENFDLAVDFLKKWRHNLPCDLMYCPQFDGTVDDFTRAITHMEHMVNYFGIRWYGLPRLIAERGFSRAELCIGLKRMRAAWTDDEPYVHALGMCNGNLRELEQLERAQCDSIDSSAPVWRGWEGYDIEAYEQWDLYGSQCDFDAAPDSLTPTTTSLIYSNLRKVGVAC